jgi:NAD-dependent SIR2 family protein deacetylase
MSAWHGHGGSSEWPAPRLVAVSDEAGRADQGNTIKANEYLDSPRVLREKMVAVASLIRRARCCTAYTGAGLSKSSGIPDYATRAANSVVAVAALNDPLQARPTQAHCVLTAMERQGFLHHYVQQNHDGLPQKSGMPQTKINEIHGAWFDPSNPVVKFGGNLRTDLFDWMERMENETDLCLCLGTSLSGMNADRMAKTPAKKSLQQPATALGTIIINLQQTSLDSKCVIRVWAKLDDAFAILQELLELEIKPCPVFESREAWAIPYDEKGKRDLKCVQLLKMGIGERIRIAVETAVNYNCHGKVINNRNPDFYLVQLFEGSNGFARNRAFGRWWLTALARGMCDTAPMVNVDAEITRFESEDDARKLRNRMNGIPNDDDDDDAAENGHEIGQVVEIQQSHSVLEMANSHNHHRWSLQVNPAHAKFVRTVEYKLHSSFNPRVIVVDEEPFEIARIGWGTFVVRIKIELKRRYGGGVFAAKHELDFSNDGDAVALTQVPLQ